MGPLHHESRLDEAGVVEHAHVVPHVVEMGDPCGFTLIVELRSISASELDGSTTRHVHSMLAAVAAAKQTCVFDTQPNSHNEGRPSYPPS
jgi:hypothetical protein